MLDNTELDMLDGLDTTLENEDLDMLENTDLDALDGLDPTKDTSNLDTLDNNNLDAQGDHYRPRHTGCHGYGRAQQTGHWHPFSLTSLTSSP